MVWKFIYIFFSKNRRCLFCSLLNNCSRSVAMVALGVAFTGWITTSAMAQRFSNDFEEFSMSEDEALLAIFSSTPTDSVVNLAGNATTPLRLHDVLFWYYQSTGGPCSSSVETNTFIQDT